MIERNWLNPFRMQEIRETSLETGDRTLIELLEIVKQVTKGKRKDNVWWLCFSYLELVEVKIGEMTKKVVKIAIGPILSGIVPLWQNKIEKRCGAKIQSCDFDVGKGSEIFFVERIVSATDIFSEDSVMRRKLSEPGGKEAIKKEIEGVVEKLDDAFKSFNGMLNKTLI
jgi:hypothetical protein